MKLIDFWYAITEGMDEDDINTAHIDFETEDGEKLEFANQYIVVKGKENRIDTSITFHRGSQEE